MNSFTAIISRLMGTYARGVGGRIRVILWLLCCLAIVAPLPASAQAPSAPTGFAVAANTGIASWTAVSGATAYSLEIQVGTSGSIATLFPGVVTSVNFTVAPNATNCCKNGTTYRSRIKVTTSGGESDWSSWDSFTFSGTTSFTGTAFSVSLSLSYDHSAGMLRITTGTNGGTGTLGTNQCGVGNGGAFDCPTGVTSLTRSAGASYTVTVHGTRGTEKHSASATINVPAGQPPQAERNLGGGQSSGGGRSSGGRSDAEPSPTVDPGFALIPTQDHSRLPAGAEVSSDSIWISMREVSGAAISDPWVRASAIAAIDVVAPLDTEAEVCFAEAGSPLLLDAAYSPRRLVWLEAYLRADGKTCARINRNGTVVLMPSRGAPTTPAPRLVATRIPLLIPDSLDSMVALENCEISASAVLRFRDRPAGRSLRLFRGTSEALARTQNWFMVNYEGREGWISAQYVTTDGDCG
jgi:hypothetical protein